MNVPFHTPSFGDEVFAVTDIESNVNACFDQHLYQQQSKRMHNSMDQSMDDYHSLNDESFGGLNNNSSTMLTSPTPTPQVTVASRKQLPTPTDPNEPAKPLSAYALFFRDTVSAIKQQNPNCSFQEISRIVASMWEALDPAHKNVYNKKNEMAKNDYIKQMRTYRMQQSEQQQQQQQQHQLMEQQQLIDHQNQLQQQQLTHLSAAVSSMQTKPAVFTIPRSNSDIDMQTFNNSTNTLNIANHIPNSPQHSLGMQYHAQQQFDLQQPLEQQQHQLQSAANNYQQHQQQQQQHQQQQHQQQQQQLQHISEPQELLNTNLSDREAVNCNDFNPPPAQQIQLLTEAGSVQKCIRENCNKRAIINPDWEDEYCSNECVVIHCRNVFNSWVQANLEGRSQ